MELCVKNKGRYLKAFIKIKLFFKFKHKFFFNFTKTY